MTKVEQLIKEVLELYPYKNGKFPLCFPQYPDVDTILDAAPRLARALKAAMSVLGPHCAGDCDIECTCGTCHVLKDIEKIVEGET